MRTPWLSFTLLATLLSPPAHADRGGVGTGGGNAIRCDDGKLYAWDFVNKKLGNLPVAPVLEKAASAKEILEKIAARLVDLSLAHGATWNDFRRFNDDLFNPETDRIWIQSQNPLIPIGDEDRTSLPKSCVANATPSFQLHQAVVRSTTDGGVKIRYEYDPALIAELERTSPLQASFLYVHEWLRDYIADAKTITLVNQLIHSANFMTGDIARAREVAAQLGLKFGVRLPVGKYVFKSGLNVLQNPVISVEPTADRRSLAYYVSGTVIGATKLYKTDKNNYWEKDHDASDIKYANGTRAGKTQLVKYGKSPGAMETPVGGLTAVVHDDSSRDRKDLFVMANFENDHGAGKCFTAHVTVNVTWSNDYNDGTGTHWYSAWQPSTKGVYCLAP